MSESQPNIALINITDHDDAIREIRLARPPANAINPDLVTALNQALDQAAEDRMSGAVSYTHLRAHET